MHSPIIISGLILLAMLTTFLGAVHVYDGKMSIEPASRNLIIWNEPVENKSVDVRGPYTVQSALENESTILRMTPESVATLELGYGDSVYIGNQTYTLNQSLLGRAIHCGYHPMQGITLDLMLEML